MSDLNPAEMNTAINEVATTAPVTNAPVDVSTIVLPDSVKNVDLTNVKFNFRKDKELGTKRPSVELAIPIPTVDGIVEILKAGGNALQLLKDALFDVIYAQARDQVDTNEGITQGTLDLSKLSWDYIANLPKAERAGTGIPKEVWEDFGKDYLEVMPAVTGKSAEQIANASKLLVGKLVACKSNKKIITFLREQVALWFANTPNAENFADVYQFLDKKAETLLLADDSALLANLGAD